MGNFAHICKLKKERGQKEMESHIKVVYKCPRCDVAQIRIVQQMSREENTRCVKCGNLFNAFKSLERIMIINKELTWSEKEEEPPVKHFKITKDIV